jgi:hypothetical protein
LSFGLAGVTHPIEHGTKARMGARMIRREPDCRAERLAGGAPLPAQPERYTQVIMAGGKIRVR